RRRIAALATVAVAAGSVAVGALVLRPDPAFAVQTEADGDVVVTIASLEDADGLERALAEHGVEAEVSYDPNGPRIEKVPADPPRGQDESESYWESSLQFGESNSCDAIEVHISDDGITFRLPASAVEADTPLRIQTAGSATRSAAIGVAWVAPVC
ncbi:hypothetical protein, partial [Nocardioides sp.]